MKKEIQNTMDEINRKKISNLLDLLTVEEKKLLVIEITEDKNKTVFDFLEKQGFLNISYSIEYELNLPIMTEKSANINLWYKNTNKTWTINMFQINKILNLNYK